MPTVQSILDQSIKYNLSILDYELLLAHTIQEDRTRLYSHPEQKISLSQVQSFKGLLKKRKKGTPLAYLVKKKPFYNLEFYVDNRVLIPRPETELIVEKILQIAPETLLDVGVGSGTIALTIAHNLKTCQVTAVDICDKALEVAKQNADNFKLTVDFYCSDLLSSLKNNSHFDVIAANLPYIGTETNSCVSTVTCQHEPHLALFSGRDGLDHYRRLLSQMQLKKITYKYVIGEFGFGQEKAIMDLLEDYDYTIENDLAGIPRIFIVKGQQQ